MNNERRFLPWYMTAKKKKKKRRGEFAGLSQSLPSLVVATGPASGSVIHSYQFAFCCIFFSLVFHSLTHATLLFKLVKKDRGHFSYRSTAGAFKSGRIREESNTFSMGRDS